MESKNGERKKDGDKKILRSALKKRERERERERDRERERERENDYTELPRFTLQHVSIKNKYD